MSIVEVEIFCFFALLKLARFWPKMVKIRSFLAWNGCFSLSLRFTRFRPRVTACLFWKIKQKWVRRWRFHFFTENSKMAPFWPKMAKTKNAFFSKTSRWNFLIFCTKPSLWSRKKNDVFAFLSKIQKWLILAKIDPNLS